MTPRVSIVIPAYNEGLSIVAILDQLAATVNTPFETLVVYDRPEDTTASVTADYSLSDSRVKPTLNTYGPGPAHALRFGVDHSSARTVVVMMADGSDDSAQIDDMVALIESGYVVVAASRYMSGGRQIGGPLLKRSLSRLAGNSLYHLGRVGTRDSTNSFKAYSKEFIEYVGIESIRGFEMGIELVAKARRRRLPVTEVPTTWLDRTEGKSSFRLVKWIPHYLRWYIHAFGPSVKATRKPGEGNRSLNE